MNLPNPDSRQLFELLDMLKPAVEKLEQLAVQTARTEEMAWREIGERLGLTGQGARKRHIKGKGE